MHEIQPGCDHVAIINRGKFLAQGSVNELLHKGKMLQMRVPDPDAASNLLMNLDWVKTIETDDSYIYIEIGEEQAAEVNRILVTAGIPVSEMKMSENSLEDFFLDAIDEITQKPEGGNA